MPANLTPEYRRADEMFRQAKSTPEKITALELMLQTIPKHKGTEHMQADLKRRLARLREGGESKSGARHRDIFHVPKGTAAGQVVLLGTCNSGKSSLLAHTTKAPVQVAEYPFTTTTPVPGIMMHEDVPIQLLDMPPITAEHVEPGQVGAYRQADLILVVLDLSAADVTDQWEICLDFLQERTLIRPDKMDQEEEFYERLVRPCLAVCTKSDLAQAGDFEFMQELCHQKMPMFQVTVKEPQSLQNFTRRIFEELRVVRIYAKQPGKKADMNEPFTLSIGSTVFDLAYKIHRELAEKFRFARIWGEDKYPGQQVPRDYLLQDKDIIELNFS